MRRWIFIFFVLGVFFVTLVGLRSSQLRFPIILPTGKSLDFKFYDYSGITHVHSFLSTGSGTISELVKAASVTHCQFLILTDLNPKYDVGIVEGYKDDVLVIGAAEHSFLAGHLLSYDLAKAPRFNGPGQAQIYFNDLLEKPVGDLHKRFVVAAHPFLSQRNWENLNFPGLQGMEIINLESMWRNEILPNKFSLLWSLLILPFNPDLAYLRLYKEPDRELSAWDEILEKRQFIGFGGSDSTANAIPLPNQAFPFPSYARSFRLLKNHVLLRSELTGSYAQDRAKILEALGQGNFYFSVDLLGDPQGFYFTGTQKGRESLPGATFDLKSGPVNFTVDMSRDIRVPHELILLRNGRGVIASKTTTLNFTTREPGAYRVVVRVSPTLPLFDGQKTITWIFTNAIRIK